MNACALLKATFGDQSEHYQAAKLHSEKFARTSEASRLLGVLKGAHLRDPAGESLDAADHEELTRLMERMGPPY